VITQEKAWTVKENGEIGRQEREEEEEMSNLIENGNENAIKANEIRKIEMSICGVELPVAVFERVSAVTVVSDGCQ
jgi:hypothetical protein